MINNTSVLYRLIGITAIDALIIAMLWPVLPGIAAQSGNPGSTIALLTVILTAGQLISAPVLGYMSDRYGRRPVFVLASVATLISNILWLPRRLPLLFATHTTDGLSNGLFAVTRSTIADITTKKNRAKYMGMMDILATAGFIIGPLIASLVLWTANKLDMDTSLSLIATAVAFSAANVLLSFTIPETSGDTQAKQQAGQGGIGDALAKGLSPRRVYTLFVHLRTEAPIVARLLIAEVLVNFATAGYTFYLIFVSLGALGFGEQAITLFFIGFGVPMFIIQGVFYQFFLHRVKRIHMLIVTSIGGALVLSLGYTWVDDSITRLGIVLALDLLTLGFVPGLIEGYRSEHIPDAIQGEVQGISQSLASAAVIISTLVYGALLSISIEAPFYWFAVCLAAIAIVVWPLARNDISLDEQHKQEVFN